MGFLSASGCKGEEGKGSFSLCPSLPRCVNMYRYTVVETSIDREQLVAIPFI